MEKLWQSINQFHDKVSQRVDTHQESGTCGQTDRSHLISATITTAVLLYMTIIELVDCMLLNLKEF